MKILIRVINMVQVVLMTTTTAIVIVMATVTVTRKVWIREIFQSMEIVIALALLTSNKLGVDLCAT